MVVKVINFLSELHGLKKVYLMFFATLLLALLEVFGLGFFILIILELLTSEKSLCLNTESFYFPILNTINLCNDISLNKILAIIISIFVVKFILQTLIIIYKSNFLSFGIYQFIHNNIIRIFRIKVDELEKQDFFLDNNSLIKEADILFNSFFNKFFDCVTEILIFLILIISLIYFDLKNLILVFILFLFCFFYFFSFSRKTKIRGQNRQESLVSLNQKFYNIFKNIKVIETIDMQKNVFNKFIKYLKIYRNSAFYHFNIVYLPRIVLENFLFIIVSLLVILSVNYTSKEAAFSYFTIYGLIFLRIVPAINRIKNSIDTLFFRLNNFNLVYEINERYKLLNVLSIDSSVNVNLKENLFIISDLNISVNKKIFINAEIVFEKNMFHCIKGPSGSGKSTLLNFLCGFKKADCFRLSDSEVYYSKYLKIMNTSYLSQKIFFEDTTLVENLLMGDENSVINKNILIEMMKELNLENFIDKLDEKVNFDGSNFSLGEQQRFLIIRTMVKKPKVLILDEPFSALDLTNQNILINYLMKYKGKLTLIMSTHTNFSKKFFDYQYEINKNNFTRIV
jgi:ABC-type transport system involved in cytochrome bd biosynthesis fused ATPase/permease subunit